MNEQMNVCIEHLKRLNLLVRQRLELAEAQVIPVNLQIRQLWATGLVSDQVFLGDVILQRPYDVASEVAGSGQVIQSALATSKGFSAVFWDAEEYLQLQRSPQLESEARLHLLRFDRCDPAIKGLLLPHLAPLIAEFMRALRHI